MPEIRYKTKHKIKPGYDLNHKNMMFLKTLEFLNVPLNVNGKKANWFRTATDCYNQHDKEVYIYVFYK